MQTHTDQIAANVPQAMAAGTLKHRHGGTITRITAIGHDTHRKVADWYFIGDVEWDDGGATKDAHISPHALCADDPCDVRPLFATLSRYLEKFGDWHEPKHLRDGRCVSWTPHAPTGRAELAAAS